MSIDERSRHDRFLFEPDRRTFLAKRALLRIVLSRYASVSPDAWRFAAAAPGKPYVAAPVVRPALYFNLSNTPGLVVCAVSVAHSQVSVDAEGPCRRCPACRAAFRFGGNERAARSADG
ncbi:hypothetical protein JQ612_13505 [Bradyrhizobium manausense]|uniref:4'-phosphopantetheinyl transferase family protein n=1 Tax=Bradyrhizobium manausense TaxID=989370 RepID=UPI001BA4C354|nr:hypothetical protein [Bradyrhizobium manausense]MBR0725550.1 hypothetical protein [Bradyrhizobium manausense]MBR0834210.1 hypothetical protein [Bradyrhizobium manausense]